MLTKITFDLADPAGIMYFANTYHLAHQNIEYWLENEYSLWEDWFNHNDYAAPIKHSECDYYKPMHVGKNYQVKTKILKTGNTSIVFQTDFYDELDNIHATVKTVHVFICKKKWSKIEVPESIKNKLFS